MPPKYLYHRVFQLKHPVKDGASFGSDYSIYAKITNQKVNEDMKILSNRIENRYELPKDDVPEFTHNQYVYDKNLGRVVYIGKGKGKRN